MKKQIAIIVSMVLLLLCSCEAAPSPNPNAADGAKQQSVQTAEAGAQGLSLYPAAANLPVGRELKLKADFTSNGAAVQWSSSDEGVATVDKNGRVSAIAPGECIITVALGGSSAQCDILVKEECRTVIFTSKPIKSDGKAPPQPPEGSDGETPIELPPDIADVDKIPQTDEFIWTLEFDESFQTLVTNEGMPLIVDVAVAFNAQKQGGKSGIGSYAGTFGGDADLDKEHFIKTMNENPEIKSSGGKLTDYTENDEGLQNVPVTLEVTMMDDAAFHEVTVGHIPENERSITQQLPIPTSTLFPGSMMALGEVSGITTISGTMTMEVMGQSMTLPFGTSESSAQPYTICIYPSGDAVLTFPLMSRDGFDRNWVEGMLTKRPMA